MNIEQITHLDLTDRDSRVKIREALSKYPMTSRDGKILRDVLCQLLKNLDNLVLSDNPVSTGKTYKDVSEAEKNRTVYDVDYGANGLPRGEVIIHDSPEQAHNGMPRSEVIIHPQGEPVSQQLIAPQVIDNEVTPKVQ